MRSLVNPSWFPFAAALLAAMLIAGRAGAQAAINVNTVIDLPDFDPLDGLCDCDQMTPGPQCSLRAAVENANFIGGWVIINIPGGRFSGLRRLKKARRCRVPALCSLINPCLRLRVVAECRVSRRCSGRLW